MQKLIKIIGDHYVVVDDSEIKTGDIVAEKLLTGKYELFETHTINDIDKLTQKKITHSTQPLKPVVIDISPVGTPIIDYEYDKIKQLSLQEVKELIGEVDLEILAANLANPNVCKTTNWIEGYNQALKDNKEKKYTQQDIINAIEYGINLEAGVIKFDYKKYPDSFTQHLQSLQPKTDWEVEIVDGKLKLK